MGKTRRASSRICGALVIAFFGNRMEDSVSAFNAACSASVDAVRFTASSPPTPFSVNPHPSCIGGKLRIDERQQRIPSSGRPPAW